jgi:hypothetical protein
MGRDRKYDFQDLDLNQAMIVEVTPGQNETSLLQSVRAAARAWSVKFAHGKSVFSCALQQRMPREGGGFFIRCRRVV